MRLDLRELRVLLSRKQIIRWIIMMQIFVIGSVLVLIPVFAMFLMLIINLLTFPKLRLPSKSEGSIATTSSMVSILVPARNEAHCIEACVRSLVAQTYKRLEVLVLDDSSSDETGAIVQRILNELLPEQTGRLRLLHGQPLPEGWIGKTFACYQLAQQAQGDYLLFTDADTVHAPETVEAVLACMHCFNVKLLTAQPEFELGSPGERLIEPLFQNFILMLLLPTALAWLRPEPSLATGNGQLLCFHRSAYEATGGHTAVKGQVLEDVQLGHAVKAAGYRMVFVDALEFVHSRMYRSFAEIWAGLSKNIFAFYNYSLPFALVALLLILILFIAPAPLAFTAIILHLPLNVLLFGVGVYSLEVLMYILLTLRFTRRKRGLMLLLCFLLPLSVVLYCLILLNSVRWYYRKTGVEWKGRHYKL